MARAQKRRFQGPNHVALDDLNGDTPAVTDTPESALTEREAMESAQQVIDQAIASSRLRGLSKLYAERFVEFAALGMETADIARRFNTSEANIRSARSRFIHVLMREGVIAQNAIPTTAVEGEPRGEAVKPSRRSSPESRH
jgi:DNA-directed RNA polymerase specialized sigma24 family protein